MDKRLRDASWCFACGPQNPIGLHLQFVAEGEEIRAEFTPGQQYQGWEGTLHGGIAMTALDEAMANLLYLRGHECVTGRIEVRFRREVPVGKPLVVTARMTGERKRFYTAEAALALADGTRLAEARATFIRPG